MKIVILGSGNVATALVDAVVSSGNPDIELVQLYSRSNAGESLARVAGASFTASLRELMPADLYVISVSDGAVAGLAESMTVPPNVTIVHTAGGVGIEAIPAANRGVIYPLQTFTKGRSVDFREIPLFIEYSSSEAEKTIRAFAGALSGNVFEADSTLRARLHVAAVFACNFTNYMYTVGSRLATDAGLSFDVLKPLIVETAAKAAASANPATVQTGPAVRGDLATIARHEQMLGEYGNAEYLEMYKLLSQNIWETLKKT